MTQQTAEPPRAEYVATAAGDRVMCLRHDAAGAAPARGGVVIVPPLAWEEVASYRERFVWAQRLTAAGHPVARFDLPGTGDSTGAAGDEDRLGRWVAAVVAVAARLRADAGCERVALLGIGFGGLLAALATAAEPVAEDLVLWEAPAGGRAAVRKVKAFARLQDDREDDGLVPEGWLEVNGNLLSAELLDAIGAVDCSTLEPQGVGRALVLGSGTRGDDPLVARLRGCGATVDEAPAPGYTEMVEHPQLLALPEAAMAVVGDWLAGAPAAEAPAPVAAPEATATLELPGGAREEPVVLAAPHGALFGVLTRPGEAPSADGLCVVLLNSGAVPHTGPNRMWVDFARHWAARGVASLRVDIPGVGDSPGDASVHRESAGLYRREVMDALPRVLEDLERDGAFRRFVVVGLCSGAYHAWWLALRERSVAGALLINVGLLEWVDEVLAELQGNRMAQRFRLSRARDFLAGRVSRAALQRAGRDAIRLARSRLARRRAGAGPGGDTAGHPAAIGRSVPEAIAELEARGTRVALCFAQGEERFPLRNSANRAAIDGAANVSLVELPGLSHELRSLPAQRRTREVLDAFLDDVRRSSALADVR